ncbi:low temperature requirement protein A [Micromonospora polyrhachis]|uniref:Low temperature requirement protein LtrA n=1 Tax=Micromonospora polyrhachis TaxID=1282883 RepID=A0A7W7SUT8_9ACTN|nr:low temperature requirement protein A [Micromonospora polyrhachis]MBB4961283.1 low temperature requirement protein LtrA [Micromonospora polyrhachis]
MRGLGGLLGRRVDGLPPGVQSVTERTQVTTAELFFDLVFVFAFIQVTTLMAEDTTGLGMTRGLLVLAMLWWAWSLYTWLGNRVRANYGLSRLVLLGATPVMFVLAITIRESFNDLPGGLDGPIVFAIGYLLVRLLYLALRLYATPALTRADLVALTVPMVAGTGLLFVAAVVPQRLTDDPFQVELWQVGFWALAVAVEYGTGLGLPMPGRRIFAAGHWAERHRLIMIIALGESIIAVGLSGADLPVSWGLVWVSVCAVVTAGALEWTYFDVVTLAGEQSLIDATPEQRTNLARHAYTYLHLPMVAGIILFSLGLKHTPYFLKPDVQHSGAALTGLALWSLYGGAALFLLGNVAFQVRITRLVRTNIWPRLVTALLLLALVPVAGSMPAMDSLVLLTVLTVTLALVEVRVAGEQRRRLRAAALAEEPSDVVEY